VHCIQNHDQIGNRAFGDRLPETASLAAYRAASALLLCSAATPMLFMGQEWAASSPFQFFTDHNKELGHAVTEGRRREFRAWSIFEDPALREQIPDPQALATFERSHLDWREREAEPHASMLRLYRALLRLRWDEPALRWSPAAFQRVAGLDDDALILYRQHEQTAIAVIALLRGMGRALTAGSELLSNLKEKRWELALTTEDDEYAASPLPIGVRFEEAIVCRFQRPGAAVLRSQWGGTRP
jgi:maltooligosyltrehalose trehalohydrolase